MTTIKELGGKIFAKSIVKKTEKWAKDPIGTQKQVFENLLATAKNTEFGKDHHFESIQTFADFAKAVPVRDYEGLKPYIDKIRSGKPDVLWPGLPLYFAKTSGTTSGAKYIPLTKESMPYHIEAARNALLLYLHETGNSAFIRGKMIFLQGSPELKTENGIKVGRLSGIVAHYVPGYLQKNRLPSWETNCIDNWEQKVDKIVDETIQEDMTLISGIPPWVQMYFERVLEKSGKRTIKEVFPNFSLFVTGGVAFEPYRKKFESLFGGKVDKVETFPASEGFFAYQDTQTAPGLLLLLNGGIFYEFIPADQFYEENPPRLTIADVEIGVNYAMIISTNAGLWGYNLGDTVQFVSKDPYRVIVSGRIKHFISAFGEHVIGSEVEKAMKAAIGTDDIQIVEFTVAPQVNPMDYELPYHEWFIEFAKAPKDMTQFTARLDKALQEQNSYYFDLISGKMLRQAVIRVMQPNAFQNYMKSIGKLGGQNKVARLTNDRKMADALAPYIQE
ncbi:MAG: GH3 auxin-responsive promoter family protein [Schleiferiaceae bacterium]|nr:GH3 auxin-responsive promoter family protein [Schleiferiaceae bacterium]